MDVAEARKLVGPCGAYCGGCGMYRGRTIARVAEDLKELIEAADYPAWVPKFGGIDFDFAEFQKGLAYLTREDSGCYCQVPCSKGGGIPRCDVRECAKERGVDICFECPDYPCEHFSSFLETHPDAAAKAERFRELGAEAWIEEQMRKAEKGYCSGTRKYYPRPSPEQASYLR